MLGLGALVLWRQTPTHLEAGRSLGKPVGGLGHEALLSAWAWPDSELS